MIRQKRNLASVLIFAAQLSLLVSATPTERTATLENIKPTISGIPTGIFTITPPIYEQNDQAAAYDDFDDYVPFRSDTHDYFSWELLKEILQEEQKSNVVISPFSVKLVLALLSEATGNNTQTQKELRSTQTDIKSPQNLRQFYRKILMALKKENPYYTLLLETKLYTDEFIGVNQPYASSLEYNYDTKVERLNFSDTQTAAQSINAWCSNVTQGHLQQLVNPDGIKNTVMLMANAIYFNGLWRRQFNESYEGVFLKTPTEQIKTTYMEQTEYFYHYDSNTMDAKILRLPYKGKKFSMFILLPKTKFGVENLARSLDNEQLKNMQFLMEEVKVKITMPKFKFEYNKNMKETLQHLGIQEIFTENASLPGLARGAAVSGKLKVSNIYQKAGIDVNEKGTEAFAATVVEIENKFGGSDAVEEFNVNRPFIFFIEEEATGNIIFAGKVVEPFA